MRMTYHIYQSQVIKTVKIDKPWGHEIIWADNREAGYISKILFIEAGKKTSKQFHKLKEETISVLSGTLKLIILKDNNEYIYFLKRGESFNIKPNLVHRFYAEYSDVELLETSTYYPEDVVRLEDEYGRC